MHGNPQALAIEGRDGSYLILDRVGGVDIVVGVRSHIGEVLSVYLMDVEINRLVEFHLRQDD
jgi:hypothetical protein